MIRSLIYYRFSILFKDLKVYNNDCFEIKNTKVFNFRVFPMISIFLWVKLCLRKRLKLISPKYMQKMFKYSLLYFDNIFSSSVCCPFLEFLNDERMLKILLGSS